MKTTDNSVQIVEGTMTWFREGKPVSVYAIGKAKTSTAGDSVVMVRETTFHAGVRY